MPARREGLGTKPLPGVTGRPPPTGRRRTSTAPAGRPGIGAGGEAVLLPARRGAPRLSPSRFSCTTATYPSIRRTCGTDSPPGPAGRSSPGTSAGPSERTGADTGLPRIRLHDTRHGCATILFAAGVAPRVVMEILGHSQIAVTMNVYTHVSEETQREALGHMDRLLKRRRKTD
ncbi:hypothetical protein CP971_23370 [Streptomyces viridifaciens]|nr:hypothetical protein CP971_23370 [Streptomyces viridifaciens]